MSEETVPFDREKLDQLLGEITDLLAELGYIDKALEYIRRRDERFGSHDISQMEDILVHLGTRHPFARTLRLRRPWYGSIQAEVEDDLEAMAGEAATWATQNMGTLTGQIGWIIHPRVYLHDYLVTELAAVNETLSGQVPADIGSLANNLGDWKGEAAEDFADNFYNPLATVFDNQASIARELARAFATSKAVARLAQHSLMNAVVYVHEALDEQLRQRREENAGPSLKEILILASSATQLMGVFGVPGMERIASLLDFGAVNIPENVAEPYTVRGATTEELFNAVFDAVRQISGNARSSYEALEAELQRLESHISELRLDRLLIPRRPVVANGFDGDGFHHVSSGRYS